MRILLVEDNFIAGLELHARLSALGHEVIGPFADVEQVLALVEREPPDAALLDFRVREGSSIEIARSLRRTGRPFVFVTGYGMPPGLPDELASHPRVGKPIADDTLQQVLALLGSG